MRYVVLLRGVMPAGKNKVPMAPLSVALTKAGFENVITYIQSGNVILDSTHPQKEVETMIHAIIQTEFGGDIIVIARTAQRFEEILHGYPFQEATNKQRYFTLLQEIPDENKVEDLTLIEIGDDSYEIIQDVIYIQVATKYSDTKIHNNFLEKKLGVSASTRNNNTIRRLVELTG